MATRLDRASISSARYDENGYLTDSPVLTRTGVFPYRTTDGSIRREYRPPDEVFHVDSLESYRGKPFTVEHQKVSAKNARGKVIGTVLTPGREDGEESGHRLLRADVVLHDPSAIKQGWKDISVGYSVDLDETPGTSPEGEKYDAIQRNIRVNHVAIVPKGRAGVSKFNVDRADAVSVEIDLPQGGDDDDDKGGNMSKIRLDNDIEYDAAPEVVHAFTQMRKDRDDANAAIDAEKARADSAEAKVKKAEEEKEQIRKDAAEEARQHLKLETVAKAQGITVRADAAPRELQVAIIKSVRGDSFDVEGKPDSYIDAACDIAIADIDAKARNDAAGRQRAAVTPPATPAGAGAGAGASRGDAEDLDAARESMRQRRNDSFKSAGSRAE